MSTEKKIVILAGPNGAGKTTFAREFLLQEADCPDFLNADLIAAGLSPFRPETVAFRAARLILSLANPNLAIARVAARVAQGGHDVPAEVIRRRFSAGLRNLDAIYKRIVDSWILFDNSAENPRRIDQGTKS